MSLRYAEHYGYAIEKRTDEDPGGFSREPRQKKGREEPTQHTS